MSRITVSRAVVLAGIVLSTGICQAASFDCAKATRRIDVAICASPQVSLLDSKMVGLYRSALDQAADMNDVREKQRLWIRSVRDKCADENCLIRVYEQRIAELVPEDSARPIAPAYPSLAVRDRTWYHVQTGCRPLRDEMAQVGMKNIPPNVTPQDLEEGFRVDAPELEAVLNYISDDEPALMFIGRRGWRKNLFSGRASDYDLKPYTFVMGHAACLAHRAKTSGR